MASSFWSAVSRNPYLEHGIPSLAQVRELLLRAVRWDTGLCLSPLFR
jgi:hypothetical protein